MQNKTDEKITNFSMRKRKKVWIYSATTMAGVLLLGASAPQTHAETPTKGDVIQYSWGNPDNTWGWRLDRGNAPGLNYSGSAQITVTSQGQTRAVYCIEPGKHLTTGNTLSDVQNALKSQQAAWSKLSDATKKTAQNVVWASKTYANGTGANDWPLSAYTQGWVWNLVTGTNGGQAPTQAQWNPDTRSEGGVVSNITWGQMQNWRDKLKERMATFDQTHKGQPGINASKINLPSFDKSTQTLIYGQTLTLKNTNNIVGTNKSLVNLTDPATKLKVNGLKFSSAGLNNTVTNDAIKLTAKEAVNGKFVVNYEASANGTPGEKAHTSDNYAESGLGAFIMRPNNDEQTTVTSYAPVITTHITKGDDGKPSSMKGSFTVNEIALGQNILTKNAVGDTPYSQAGAVFEIINKTTGKVVKDTNSASKDLPIAALVGTMTKTSDGTLRFTTNAEGKVGVKNLLVTQKYAWKEVKAPAGHAINTDEIPFQFDTTKNPIDDGTKNIVSPETKTADKPAGELKLIKTATNDKYNAYIAGAQYQFYKDTRAVSKLTQPEGFDLKNGKVVSLNLLNDTTQKWTNSTDANVTLGKSGVADIGFVDISKNKNFSVKESKAPKGFALDPKVHKLVFDKDSALNAQKSAFIEEGKSQNKPIGELNVSKDEYRPGAASSTGNDKEQDPNISFEGAIFEIVDDKGIPVKVKTAVDPKTGEDNAEYTITKGEAVERDGKLAIKAGKDGKIGVQGLDVSKSTRYGVKEVVAPYGYTVNDKIVWTENFYDKAPGDNGYFTQDVTVHNAVIDFNFGFSKESIAKTNSTSNKVGEGNAYFLNGSQFTLTPQEGTIDDGSYEKDQISQNKEDIQGFVQGGWVQFTKVRVGKYDLVETKVPNGYKAVDPMTVEISSDKYDGGSTEYTFTVKNKKTGKEMYTRTVKIDEYKSFEGNQANENNGFGYDESVSMGSFNLGILTDQELIPTINSQAFDVSDKEAVNKMIAFQNKEIAKVQDQLAKLTNARDEATKAKDEAKVRDLTTQIEFAETQLEEYKSFVELIQSNNNTHENILPDTKSVWDENANSTLNVVTTDPTIPNASELTEEYLSNKGNLVAMFEDHTMIFKNNAVAKVVSEENKENNSIQMKIFAKDNVVTFDFNLSTGKASNIKLSSLAEAPKLEIPDENETSKDDNKATDGKVENPIDQSVPKTKDAKIGDVVWGTGLHANTKYYYNNVLFNQKTGKAVKAQDLGQSALDQVNMKASENANATYLGTFSNIKSVNVSNGVVTLTYKDGQTYTSSKAQTREFNLDGSTTFRMSSGNGVVTFLYNMQNGIVSDLKTDNESKVKIGKDDIVYVQGSFFTDENGNYATLAPTTSIDTTKVKDPMVWQASVYLNEAPKPTDSVKPTGDYVVYDARDIKTNTPETITPSVPLIKTKAHTEDGNNIINLTERGENTKVYDNISYQNTLSEDYIGNKASAYVWRIKPGEKPEKVGQVDFTIDNQQVVDQVHDVATEVDTSNDPEGTIYTWSETIFDEDGKTPVVSFNDDHKDQDESLKFETSPGRGGITPTQNATDTGGQSNKGVIAAVGAALTAAALGVAGFFGYKKRKEN